MKISQSKHRIVPTQPIKCEVNSFLKLIEQSEESLKRGEGKNQKQVFGGIEDLLVAAQYKLSNK